MMLHPDAVFDQDRSRRTSSLQRLRRLIAGLSAD
jgi:hypothetical protein